MHFEHLEPEAEEDDSVFLEFMDLFREVGDALRTGSLYKEALRFYVRIRGFVEDSDSEYFKCLAHCYREAGMIDNAEECWRVYAKTKVGFSDIMGQRDFIHFLTAAGEEARAEPYRADLAWKRQRKFKLIAGFSGQTGPMFLGDADEPIETIEPGDEASDEAEQARMSPRKAASKKKGRRHAAMPLAEEQDNLQPILLSMKDLRDEMKRGDRDARTKWMQKASSLLAIFGRATVFFPYDKSVKFLGYSADARARACSTRKRVLEMDELRAYELGVPLGQTSWFAR